MVPSSSSHLLSIKCVFFYIHPGYKVRVVWVRGRCAPRPYFFYISFYSTYYILYKSGPYTERKASY